MDKRQKKRLKRNKAKFGNRKHAVRGIISTVLAAVSLSMFCILIIVSYNMKGNAGVYLGTLGITSLFINIVGLSMGIKSFRERERNYLFSKIGLIANIIMILGWSGIYILGM